MTDKLGNVWLGNAGGVFVMKDGAEVMHFDASNSALKNNSVGNIALDSTNNIWVTYGNHNLGISKYDGNTWTTFPKGNNGLNSNQLSKIAVEPNGDIWVASQDSGVIKYDGVKWTPYTMGNTLNQMKATRVNQVIEGKNGLIYMSTDIGFYKFDGTKWTLYNNANTSGILPNLKIYKMAADKNGNIWMCFGLSGGIIKYDGTNFILYTKAITWGLLPNDNVTSIAVDTNGVVWTASHSLYIGDGVTSFDGVNWKSYKTWNYSGKMQSNIVDDIHVDKTNKKWFVFDGGNTMSSFNGVSWEIFNYYNPNYPNKKVQSIASDTAGNVWFTCALGYSPKIALMKYDKNGIWSVLTTASTNGGLYNNEPTKICCYNNELWLSYNNLTLVTKFDGLQWTTYDIKLFNTRSNSIFADKKGNKWFCVNGVIKYDNTDWKLIDKVTTLSCMVSNSVTAIAFDKKNRKWFGTNLGVSVYDNIGWDIINALDGLTNTNVHDIAIDTLDRKWIGGNNGVSIYDGVNWDTLDMSNGLPNNNINTIVLDKQTNEIWIACQNAGLVKHSNGNLTTYTVTTNPLLGNNNLFQINVDQFGAKWISSISGITKILGNSWKLYNQKNTNFGFPSGTRGLAFDS